jgi:hypothetical protein|nr:hypothetical protein [Kofleriaceae bacterium]
MIRAVIAVTVSLTSAACVVGDGGAFEGGSGSGSGSSHAPAVGVVTAPAPGTVIAGDPSSLSIHVTGSYSGADELSIQVLADPDDLTSWTTIGTATASAGAFAADVQPVDSAADAARWPAGGVLRLQVVDGAGDALAYDPDDGSLTTIAVANPGAPPTEWQFLAQKPTGSDGETSAYYAAIAAPTTLAAFQSQFGFGSATEAAARYYNAGDLGIGRDMHCVATQQLAGGVACYVSNYGTFGGSQDDALAKLEAAGTPLATVAMVYAPPITSPNSVQFMVYTPAGALATHAQLDTVGDNVSIPQNCLNCHGGKSSYDAGAHAASAARFLAFDPNAFAFPSDDPTLTLDAQSGQLAALDTLVMQAAPTDTESAVISGSWSGAAFDAGFVPDAWASSDHDRRVYSDAIAPYCRSCHASVDGGNLTFATPDDVRANSQQIVQTMCSTDPHGMPAAQQTAKRFFASPARALLLEWLGAAGACAPQ